MTENELQARVLGYLHDSPQDVKGMREWMGKLSSEDPIVIVGLIAEFNNVHSQHALINQGMRDSLSALLNVKLTRNLIKTMSELDHSATRLSKIGIVLSVAVGVASIVITMLSIL